LVSATDCNISLLPARPYFSAAARRHNVNMLLSNSTFLIFAVLVVWCRSCRR